MHQFEPFWRCLDVDVGRACKIPAGSVQAIDKSCPYGVTTDCEDNRYRRRCRFQRKRGRRGGRNNHLHLTTDQIGRQRW